MRITQIVHLSHSFTAEMRKRAWPILVGLNRDDGADPSAEPRDDNQDAALLLSEKGLELIRCDAGRSVLFRYQKQSPSDDSTPLPSGESSSQHDLSYADQQEQLKNILVSTLSGKSSLYYYQGLHDIAGVLLYNLQNVHHASAILKRLCRVHLRDALRKDLCSLVAFLNTVLLPLLDTIDAEMHDVLVQLDLELSNVILPWILTLFTHDIHNEHVASRLMDAFLSSHALFPLYVIIVCAYTCLWNVNDLCLTIVRRL